MILVDISYYTKGDENMTKITTKIEQIMDKMVEEKWESIAKETLLEETGFPKELLSILKLYFKLGYAEGQADLFVDLQELFWNDPDSFETLFDEDDSILQ